MFRICQLSEPEVQCSTIHDVMTALNTRKGHLSIKFKTSIGMANALFITVQDDRITHTYSKETISQQDLTLILSK